MDTERRLLQSSVARYANAVADMLREAADENEQLRLQRDVLALNWGQKNSQITIAMDAGNVVSVSWPDPTASTESPVRLPRWFTDHADV